MKHRFIILMLILLILGSALLASANTPTQLHDCPEPGYEYPIVLTNVDGVSGDVPICVGYNSYMEYRRVVGE